jgi:hypothetical protein
MASTAPASASPGRRRRTAAIPADPFRPAPETLEKLEFWLDRAFRVPGTDIRFGLDALLGLVPGFGDTATALISGAFIIAGWRAGARKRALAQMAWNVVVDWLVGLIPLVGDIFDVVHRANTKNLRLLREEIARQGADRAS